MSKTKEPWTVLVWNDNNIQIIRGVGKKDVDLTRRNMQTTIQDDDKYDDVDSDPRWQAWEGHAKIEVI